MGGDEVGTGRDEGLRHGNIVLLYSRAGKCGGKGGKTNGEDETFRITSRRRCRGSSSSRRNAGENNSGDGVANSTTVANSSNTAANKGGR